MTRVVLVTGANRGIGRELARRLDVTDPARPPSPLVTPVHRQGRERGQTSGSSDDPLLAESAQGQLSSRRAVV